MGESEEDCKSGGKATTADIGKGLADDKRIGRRVHSLGAMDRQLLKKGEAYKCVDDDGGGQDLERGLVKRERR